MPKNASSPAGGLLGGGIGAGEHHDVGIEMGFFIHEDQKDDADDDATDDGQRDQAAAKTMPTAMDRKRKAMSSVTRT